MKRLMGVLSALILLAGVPFAALVSDSATISGQTVTITAKSNAGQLDYVKIYVGSTTSTSMNLVQSCPRTTSCTYTGTLAKGTYRYYTTSESLPPAKTEKTATKQFTVVAPVVVSNTNKVSSATTSGTLTSTKTSTQTSGNTGGNTGTTQLFTQSATVSGKTVKIVADAASGVRLSSVLIKVASVNFQNNEILPDLKIFEKTCTSVNHCEYGLTLSAGSYQYGVTGKDSTGKEYFVNGQFVVK